MINRRLAVTGLSVLAAASLALTACTSGAAKTTSTPSTAASVTASPSAPAIPTDATAALTAALADLTTTGFDYKQTDGATSSDGMKGGGTIDPNTKSGSLSEMGSVQGTPVEISAIQIGTSFWVKVNLGPLNSTLGLPTSWMSVDPSKVTAKDVPFNVNGGGLIDLTGVFASTSSVKFSDPTTITGTVDLTKATGSTAPDVSADGAKAAATPFTAKLDAQGRLTSLVVDTSGYDKDNSVDFTFSNYGSPSAVTAPSGAVPAPAAGYTFLNGS